MNYDSVNISYEDFKERFLQVYNPRDQALFATIYCAYARVGEIVHGRYDKSPSIKREHFEFTPSHLLLTVHTEKRGGWRRVPTSRELEDWLHEPIRNYLNSNSTEQVFPISTMWAEKRFEKWFGTQHIHLLRHWACTHCLEGKRTKVRLKAQDVAKLGGWKDLNSFYSTYDAMISEDLKELI